MRAGLVFCDRAGMHGMARVTPTSILPKGENAGETPS